MKFVRFSKGFLKHWFTNDSHDDLEVDKKGGAKCFNQDKEKWDQYIFPCLQNNGKLSLLSLSCISTDIINKNEQEWFFKTTDFLNNDKVDLWRKVIEICMLNIEYLRSLTYELQALWIEEMIIKVFSRAGPEMRKLIYPSNYEFKIEGRWKTCLENRITKNGITYYIRKPDTMYHITDVPKSYHIVKHPYIKKTDICRTPITLIDELMIISIDDILTCTKKSMCVLAGNSLLQPLMCKDDNFDHTIYFVGGNYEEALEDIKEFWIQNSSKFKHFGLSAEKNNFNVYINTNDQSMFAGFHFHYVLTKFNSVEDLLISFSLDCHAFGYHPNIDIVSIPRGVRSLCEQTLIVDPSKYCDEYINDIFYYRNKGFSIIIPILSEKLIPMYKLIEWMLVYKKDFNKHKDFIKHCGLSKLLFKLYTTSVNLTKYPKYNIVIYSIINFHIDDIFENLDKYKRKWGIDMWTLNNNKINLTSYWNNESFKIFDKEVNDFYNLLKEYPS